MAAAAASELANVVAFVVLTVEAPIENLAVAGGVVALIQFVRSQDKKMTMNYCYVRVKQ